MSRDIKERLAEPTVIALRCAGDQWPHSLLSAAVIPDAWMGLVETRDGRRRFVPAGEDPRAERGDQLVLVRNRPITVPLDVTDCRAACGNTVSATCELLVRWNADEHDLAALRKALLTQHELTLDGLANVVADAGGQTALQQLIRRHPAAKLVHEDQRDALLDAACEKLKRFLFETGMVLDRVAKLELSSESLARHEARERQAAERVERIETRKMVEQAALAATQRRLDDLGGLLEKLKTAAEADVQVQWRDLLPALSPAERGRLLENLWRITPDRKTAEAIVVVAGKECVWLDPANPEHVTRRVTLGDELGGLRSVTACPDRQLLAVGASRGVWTVNAANGDVTGKYEVPNAGEPQTGFNAAALAGERLFATHSQLGCWCWPLDRAAEAHALLEPVDGVPKTVRAVTTTEDGRLLFAADDCVHIFDAEGQSLGGLDTGGKVIHCLAVLENAVYAGTANGMLLEGTLDETRELWLVVHRAPAAIETVQARRWSDLVELVIPAGVQGVCGVYGEEGVVTRLLESRTPIRRAWACDDLILALNELRDRLIVMNANLPDRTGRDVPIARLLGHSIQDAAIVATTEEGEHDETTGAVRAARPSKDEAESA